MKKRFADFAFEARLIFNGCVYKICLKEDESRFEIKPKGVNPRIRKMVCVIKTNAMFKLIKLLFTAIKNTISILKFIIINGIKIWLQHWYFIQMT
jgi:hypothetical protein